MREVTQAATSLGYAPEPKERSAVPGMPWEKTGYVAVKKSGGRIATLRSLSVEIVKARQKEAQAPEPKREKR
jgi:signal recognition particle subunit SEC65